MDAAATLSRDHAGGLLPPVCDATPAMADMPRDLEPWALHVAHSGAPDARTHQSVLSCLRNVNANGGWRWPARPVVFVSDAHADAEAFVRSLIVAGVVRRRECGALALTPFGRQARIVIGGDCLDKGPSNLALLDAVAGVMRLGPDLHILAGNHDLRLRLAVGALAGPRHVLSDHLFVRMGRKIIPLLREIHDRYVTPEDMARVPDEAACRARILPPAGWAEAFPAAAAPHLNPVAIQHEIAKLSIKLAQFDAEVARMGLSWRMVLAAARKCQQVFFEPAGPYAWFYDHMDVVARIDSLLFVHAGLCDTMCDLLAEGGPDAVNARYRDQARRAPFACYFGPLANLVRTKYRTSDKHLSATGVETLHRIGVHMVVQGHVNNHAGQRVLAKQGMLHLEGDVTLDRVSRRIEGLSGIGAGATLIFPTGDIVGISRDYPRIKHFAPERYLKDDHAHGQ